jgi:uncharacterized protein YlxW (UPF0749 family)
MKKQKVKKSAKSTFNRNVSSVLKESKSLNVKGKKFVKNIEKKWKASEPERKEMKKDIKKFVKKTQKNWKDSKPERRELEKSIKKGTSDIFNKTIKVAKKFK